MEHHVFSFVDIQRELIGGQPICYFFYSLLITRSDLPDLSMSQYKVVSSEYMIILKTFVHIGKSFMYIENNNGPRIEPCGTPVVIFRGAD